MTLTDLVQQLADNTIGSLLLFRTELALCATILLMLLMRLFNLDRWVHAFLVTLVGSAVGLWFAVEPLVQSDVIVRTELFTGLLVYDRFTLFFRAILLFFVVLFALFTRLSGIPDREDAPDFYSLVLGATLGMCLMASANHLLMIFLAVEMASVPSYVLAGMLKGRRRSSEAALKYSVYGAGTAGVMLYGISLLAGVLGSCHLPTMAQQLALVLADSAMNDRLLVLVLGGLMMMVGLAFKLSAVPFHFWCPDVFEGASAEVNAFLSVASKAAALALLVRVAVGFSYIPEQIAQPEQTRVLAAGFMAVADPPQSTVDELAADSNLTPVRGFIVMLVAFLSAITCTFGNLAAYGQTNIKRLLAYSTIAHAGYMMMPVAAGVALIEHDSRAAEIAIGSIAFYAAIYLFMNLGAFAIVAFLRNTMRSEEIADYGGLIRTSPGIVVCLGVILFSLVGLPPLSGFAGKWAIFYSLYSAIQAGVAVPIMWALLVVAGLNTALSLFYYLGVVKVMAMDPVPENRVPADFSMVSLQGAFVTLVTVPVFVLGIFWNELYRWASDASLNLLQ